MQLPFGQQAHSLAVCYSSSNSTNNPNLCLSSAAVQNEANAKKQKLWDPALLLKMQLQGGCRTPLKWPTPLKDSGKFAGIEFCPL